MTLRQLILRSQRQKANDNRKHNNQTNARQGVVAASAEPLKIGASTSFDFSARSLTAYWGASCAMGIGPPANRSPTRRGEECAGSGC